MPHIETEASDTKPVTTQAQGFRNITAGPLIRRAGDVVGLQEAYDEVQSLRTEADRLRRDVNGIGLVTGTGADIAAARLNQLISDVYTTYPQLPNGTIFSNAGGALLPLASITFARTAGANTALTAKAANSDYFLGTSYSHNSSVTTSLVNAQDGWFDGSADLPGSQNADFTVTRNAVKQQTFRGLDLEMLTAGIGLSRDGNNIFFEAFVINRGARAEDYISQTCHLDFRDRDYDGIVPRLYVRLTDISYASADVTLTDQHLGYRMRGGYFALNQVENGGHSGEVLMQGNPLRCGVGCEHLTLQNIQESPLRGPPDEISNEEALLVYDTFAALQSVTIEVLVEAKFTLENNCIYRREWSRQGLLDLDSLDSGSGDILDEYRAAAVHQSLMPRSPPLFQYPADFSSALTIPAIFAQDMTPRYHLPNVGEPLLTPYRLIGRNFLPAARETLP